MEDIICMMIPDPVDRRVQTDGIRQKFMVKHVGITLYQENRQVDG
ncbi:MAG: hypothetical protein ACLU80_17545 [Dorea sp.]